MVTLKFLISVSRSDSGQVELHDLIGRSGRSVQVDLTCLLDPEILRCLAVG